MRLVTFLLSDARGARARGERPRAGILTDSGIVELSPAILSGTGAQATVSSAVDVLAHPDLRETARSLWAAAEHGSLDHRGEVHPVESVVLLPPVPHPAKFICVGLNYRSHAEEAGLKVGDVPTFFAKFPNAITGHGHPIVVPAVTSKIDWEGELAVVIGKRAHQVAVGQALNYVAGYTIVNDVSARDYQFKTSQWMLGKTFDTFGPMGPCLVDAAAIPDPQQLDLSTTVNGELKQSTSTSDMVFSVAELVAFLSTAMTLEAGDVISTGTPSGIGAFQDPRQWLRPGDVVEVTIDGIGTLTNAVVSYDTDVAASSPAIESRV